MVTSAAENNYFHLHRLFNSVKDYFILNNSCVELDGLGLQNLSHNFFAENFFAPLGMPSRAAPKNTYWKPYLSFNGQIVARPARSWSREAQHVSFPTTFCAKFSSLARFGQSSISQSDLPNAVRSAKCFGVHKKDSDLAFLLSWGGNLGASPQLALVAMLSLH